MNYGESFNPSINSDQFSMSCPTSEPTFNNLFFNDDGTTDDESQGTWFHSIATNDNTFDASIDTL